MMNFRKEYFTTDWLCFPRKYFLLASDITQTMNRLKFQIALVVFFISVYVMSLKLLAVYIAGNYCRLYICFVKLHEFRPQSKELFRINIEK